MELKTVITILLTTILQQYASGAISLTTSPEGEVCPGDVVTFTCRVTDTSLEWEYQGQDETVGAGSDPATLGPFRVERTNVETDGGGAITAITSTATVTATTELDSDTITCIDNSLITPVERNGTLNVTTTLSPPSVTDVTELSPTSVRVVLEPPPGLQCVDNYTVEAFVGGILTREVTTDSLSVEIPISGLNLCRDIYSFIAFSNGFGFNQSGNSSEYEFIPTLSTLPDVSAVTRDGTILEWEHNAPEECIESYTIYVGGFSSYTTPDNATSASFSDINLELCEDSPVIVTPSVSAIGLVNSSSSGAYIPTDGFPSPESVVVTETTYLSDGVNYTVELQNAADLEARFPGATVSIGSGLTEVTCLNSPSTLLDYNAGTGTEENVVVCVTFELRDCSDSTNITTERYPNIIASRTVLNLTETSATVVLMYATDVNAMGTFIITGIVTDGNSTVVSTSTDTYPDTEISFTGLSEGTRYDYDISIRPNGEPDVTIGETSGEFTTSGGESTSGSEDIVAIAVGAAVGGVIVLVLIAVIIVILYIICRSGKSGGAHISAESDSKQKDPEELHLHDRPSPEPTDNLPTYADPQEIKREEFPGTEDVYTMPDKKKKTHRPEDHLPTYADPSAIEHETAPATGDLYTVVDKPKRSSRKQPPPPPEGPLQTYAEVDVTKKQRGRELNYSDIQVTGTGDMPTRQPGVIYSDVAPHQHH